MEDKEESSFKPAIGDLVKKRAPEGIVGACRVVLRVYEDMVGGRFYFIQMNSGLIYGKGPERLTQEDMDMQRMEPATADEWRGDLLRNEEIYAEEKAKLLEAVQPYVSGAGK